MSFTGLACVTVIALVAFMCVMTAVFIVGAVSIARSTTIFEEQAAKGWFSPFLSRIVFHSVVVFYARNQTYLPLMINATCSYFVRA